jgi:hypothetical protein
MTLLQTSHEGELMVDHRASPGLPGHPRSNWDGRLCPPGKQIFLRTMGCKHCNAVVVPNPWRVRERGFCRKCMRYICDYCAADMQRPDYVHRPFDELMQMVGSGKFTLTGPFWKPVLTPTGD